MVGPVFIFHILNNLIIIARLDGNPSWWDRVAPSCGVALGSIYTLNRHAHSSQNLRIYLDYLDWLLVNTEGGKLNKNEKEVFRLGFSLSPVRHGWRCFLP